MTLQALSIKQPWCWAIVNGSKRIENRTWTTSHRGPIAIHASLQWDKGGERSQVVQSEWDQFVRHLPPMNCHHGPLRKSTAWMEFGAVLAVADVVDVCTAKGDHTACRCGSTWAAPYQCHWKLDNVRRLREPVPCKGALQLWRLPEDVDAAVRVQLTERAA
jgi:hypothetical protein